MQTSEEIILPPKLEDCLKSIIKRYGFESYDIKKRKLLLKGEGYMGQLYEIDINGDINDKSEEIHIFAKHIISDVDNVKIYSVPELFKREMFVYKELSDIFTELQNEAKVPETERYNIAEYFDECNEDIIILDNLAKKGFKTYNRMDVVSIEYAKLAIEQLARFHGLSLILKKKRPDYFEKNIAPLKQPYVIDAFTGFMKNMFNVTTKYLEDGVKEKVKDQIWDITSKYFEYMQDTSSVSTLCHGDFRHNNVMAKEINEKVVAVVTVDYQIMHYGCPIQDFIYFIYWGTDRNFRKNHLDDLKNLYYECMSKFLQYFEIDIEEVYPRQEFENVYKKKLDFALMINTLYTPFLFASEDDVPDVTTDSSLSDLKFKLDERFKERFRGVVEDFIEWGYIKLP